MAGDLETLDARLTLLERQVARLRQRRRLPPMVYTVDEPREPEPASETMTAWMHELQTMMVVQYLARHYGTPIEDQQRRWEAYQATA